MSSPAPDDANFVFPVFIGRCVYCDSTDDLSDEHVLPFGLGGQWQLLKASCGVCRDITSVLELRMLREHFLAVRTVAALPTRRKKERPNVLRQKLWAKDQRIEQNLDPDKHPAPIVFPILTKPIGKAGPEPAALSYQTIRVARRNERLEVLAAETGADRWTLPCADPDTFMRFLAKVGYCFAVGSYGIENIGEHYVRPYIRASGPGLARFVGCLSPDDEEEPNGEHHLNAVVEDRVIKVTIRLFAVRGSPTYEVLVGSVREALSEPSPIEA